MLFFSNIFDSDSSFRSVVKENGRLVMRRLIIILLMVMGIRSYMISGWCSLLNKRIEISIMIRSEVGNCWFRLCCVLVLFLYFFFYLRI